MEKNKQTKIQMYNNVNLLLDMAEGLHLHTNGFFVERITALMNKREKASKIEDEIVTDDTCNIEYEMNIEDLHFYIDKIRELDECYDTYLDFKRRLTDQKDFPENLDKFEDSEYAQKVFNIGKSIYFKGLEGLTEQDYLADIKLTNFHSNTMGAYELSYCNAIFWIREYIAYAKFSPFCVDPICIDMILEHLSTWVIFTIRGILHNESEEKGNNFDEWLCRYKGLCQHIVYISGFNEYTCATGDIEDIEDVRDLVHILKQCCVISTNINSQSKQDIANFFFKMSIIKEDYAFRQIKPLIQLKRGRPFAKYKEIRGALYSNLWKKMQKDNSKIDDVINEMFKIMKKNVEIFGKVKTTKPGIKTVTNHPDSWETSYKKLSKTEREELDKKVLPFIQNRG